MTALVALSGSGARATPETAVSTATPPLVVTQAFSDAKAARTYPTFASIPPAPKGVRGFDAWKTSILAIRGQGDELTHMAAVEPWTLHDTDAWANEERGAAIPPPQITIASSPADTAAFAAALRARATPPPRKR